MNLSQLLFEFCASGGAPGAVAGWVDITGKRQVEWAGSLRGNTSQPVTAQTVYDTASLTKSLCTGLLAHWLHDTGQWQWSDLLTHWLPEYQGGQRDTLTLGHLMSFGAPFDFSLAQYKDLPPADLWQHICTAPLSGKLAYQPSYNNTTSILLGQAIERATGKTLPQLAQEVIWQPLRMEQTTFTPQLQPTIAPSEIDPWRQGEVCGEVHDESAWKLRPLFTAGSAGLFSTVPDILQLLTVLLRSESGPGSGLSLLSEATLRSFGENAFSPPWSGSLGWELNAEWMGAAPPGTFGKTGFTGCCVVANRERGRAGVLLSNVTYPTRPRSRTALTSLRQQFCQIVLARP